ncbi:MAG: hypothetical protein P4M01_04550 [Acidobacteriota bacterium]|nr:hypothetical protein [Acidobacteriota bacterium]
MQAEIDERKPKVLFGGEQHPQPGWFVWSVMKATRVLGFTLLWAGIGMAVGLFFGILFVMLATSFQHHVPDMSLAYRVIAVPVAAVCGGVAFVWTLVGIFRAGRGKQQG